MGKRHGELTESRLEQLEDARRAALHARHVRQRDRLKKELAEVEEKLAAYAEEQAAPAAVERARRVARDRCSAAGRAMQQCAVANREQRRMEGAVTG